jgi:hypothetical protein
MPKFKVGDRVYVDGSTTSGVRVKGTGVIVKVVNDSCICTVLMAKPYIDRNGTPIKYFAAFSYELHLLKATNDKDIKIVFYIKDYTVHCKLFSAEGLVSHTQATCSPDDTFDFLTGVQIALQRMLKEQNKELVLPALKNIKFIDFN